jgi:beta-glucanase (GH16 family)
VGALLFADDFNGAAGTKPDPTKWSAKAFTSNSSGTVWDGTNLLHLDGNGNLVITASLVNGVWRSGYLQQWPSSFHPPYYAEAIAKVPAGYGTWAQPIWVNGGHGAPQLEVDIIEQLGREPTVYHASLHNWTAPGVQTPNSQAVQTNITLANGFHRYGAAVYHDHADFYFDGKLVKTATAASVGLTDFTTFPQCLNVALEMGGKWAGAPTIPGPVSMLVGYVRVWEAT